MVNRSVRDGFQLLSKATPQKIYNATLILSSYFISKFLGKPVQWGLPIALSFEPTTSCNLRCPECPSGLRSFTRPTGMLNDELYKNTIDQLAGKLWYLLFYFQGEPYLHQQFFELIRYAKEKNIYTATSTNGHYLSKENAKKTVESGLDRLVISIDGTTQETYEGYRIGGSLYKVLEGAKNLVESKKQLKSKTPHIIFQFLVVKHNEHQLDDVKKLAVELGVDEVGFKTAQVYNYKNGNNLIPENEKYSRYRKLADGSYKPKNQFLNHCWKLWHSCVITWDGTVVPCCFDKDASYKMGSLKEKSFHEIWGNENYRNFRSSVVRSRGEIDMCKNCSEGLNVWAV